MKVLDRLTDAGFETYLVGGGVRDLLLGREPKDFDIATAALPEDVRKLFKNSRIIGRRFRLVHVRYGREIIEVAKGYARNYLIPKRIALEATQDNIKRTEVQRKNIEVKRFADIIICTAS